MAQQNRVYQNTDAEIYESVGKDIDFDERNEEERYYTRYGGSQLQQQNMQVIQEQIEPRDAMQKFSDISEKELDQRFKLKKSRQAIIAGRLMRIQAELQKLDLQLKQDEQQSQTQQSTTTSDSAAQENLKEMDQLKQKLVDIYKMQGFQSLLKNYHQLRDPQIMNNMQNGENANQSQIQELIAKLTPSANDIKQSQEQGNDEPQTVKLMMDRSKQDIGTILRLSNMQKRINFIKHVLGEWKSSSRYKSVTEQIEYVQKRLDLLDQHKVQLYSKRATVIQQEIKDLSDAQEIEERARLSHNKELIDELYNNAKRVKPVLANLPKIVERLEQKKKMHEMSAQVLLELEQIEDQQKQILESCQENKELLAEVKQGMDDNLQIVKNTMQALGKKE